PTAAVIEMPEGEQQKTLAAANDIVSALIDHGAQRDSCAVAVGGGMIGDTAGFAAAIFLRGIDLIHVPTTLLAQVDSSIGGKVAVNHARGKNLIGAFHPPIAVVADTSILRSLPSREILSGIFEAMKAGVIGDPELFELFLRSKDAILGLDPDAIEQVVRRAIQVKASIVAEDERETDRRRLLNYGHTIGHAIEAALGYEGLTHGEAVAWGMIAANAVAARRGILPEEERRRIDDVLLSYRPAPVPPVAPDDVLRAAQLDKKNTRSARLMILPRGIGECEIVRDISDDDLRHGLSAALNRANASGA
ncbi:MAG TPA: 3-dehydroquinate synthase, partial [Thermoanaerobaculia bacterium]|nr:3-dehydroquinate synthase [Thermoanaerobaculia bacterium]